MSRSSEWPWAPRIPISSARPRWLAQTVVPDKLHLLGHLQESSQHRARGPQESASVQVVLACSRRRGPRQIASSHQSPGIDPPEARGAREFVSVQANSWGGLWWGGSTSPRPQTDHKAQARACPRLFAPTDSSPSCTIPKRKRGRILGVAYGGVEPRLPVHGPIIERNRGPNP